MTIMYSILVMALLGVGAGVFLAFASAKFAVKEDPKVKLIEAALPGINCGACGFPGCSAFAKAIAQGKAPLDGCIPGRRSGVPEKLKVIMDSEADKLISLYEEAGEDSQKALEKLLEASGKTVKASPKPSRPSPDEIESYKEKLKENKRARLIYSVLPNINCGICGSPGCAAFALDLASGKQTAEKCVPGKRQNVAEKVAKIMALSDEEVDKVIEETGGAADQIKKKFESQS